MSGLWKLIADPRAHWQGVTTPDGLTVEGCELDGFHVHRGGTVLASYYVPQHGEAGRCLIAALESYRELEQRRAMRQE